MKPGIYIVEPKNEKGPRFAECCPLNDGTPYFDGFGWDGGIEVDRVRAGPFSAEHILALMGAERDNGE